MSDFRCGGTYNCAGVPCIHHATSQDRGAAPSPLSAPNRTVRLPFVLSTGVPSQSRDSGIASLPTRPSRSCRSAKHPARSASTLTSIASHGSFSAPHVRMKLRSLPSPRLSPWTANPGRLNCNGPFQRRSINEAPNPRGRPSDGSGGDRAARGVSSWSLFRCLCFSVAAWRRKEAPDGGDFGYFGLDSRPRAHAAGQHGPCAEVREAAGLILWRLHFGGFAPRAWRVSAGRLKTKSRFFRHRHSACSFGSFLIRPFEPS